MSSTGGGIVVHPNDSQPITGNGKTITITNNSASDVTYSDDQVGSLVSVLPDGATITIPA